MKTTPLNLETGELFAFEIENVYISIRKAATVLGSVDEVSDIRIRKLFSKDASDVHIKFKYLGKEYILMEPYGDSSEYWIGPDQDDEKLDVSALEKAFKQYRPQAIVKIFGDLISLNFKSLFKGADY